MENASKALLMVGAVLISILVMTVGVYFARTISDYSSNTYKRLEEHRKNEYNQQFFSYDNFENPERELLTIQDVATLIYLAKNCNQSNEAKDPPSDIYNTSSLYITVDLSQLSSEFSTLLAPININNYNGKTYQFSNAEEFPEELINAIAVDTIQYFNNKH